MVHALFFGRLTWGTQNTQADGVEQFLEYEVVSSINISDTAESSHR